MLKDVEACLLKNVEASISNVEASILDKKIIQKFLKGASGEYIKKYGARK